MLAALDLLPAAWSFPAAAAAAVAFSIWLVRLDAPTR